VSYNDAYRAAVYASDVVRHGDYWDIYRVMRQASSAYHDRCKGSWAERDLAARRWSLSMILELL